MLGYANSWSLFVGRFVNEFLNIGYEQMQFLVVNEPHIVDDVEVTAIDANQLVLSLYLPVLSCSISIV